MTSCHVASAKGGGKSWSVLRAWPDMVRFAGAVEAPVASCGEGHPGNVEKPREGH